MVAPEASPNAIALRWATRTNQRSDSGDSESGEIAWQSAPLAPSDVGRTALATKALLEFVAMARTKICDMLVAAEVGQVDLAVCLGLPPELSKLHARHQARIVGRSAAPPSTIVP